MWKYGVYVDLRLKLVYRPFESSIRGTLTYQGYVA